MSQIVTAYSRAFGALERNPDSREEGGPPGSIAAWIRVLIAIGTLVGMALSPKLWLGHRDYPRSPVTPILETVPDAVGTLTVAAFVASMIAMSVLRRPAKAIVFSLCSGSFLACLDQSRLQPWFYQYLLMLLAILYYYLRGATASQRVGSINACRLIIASIYIWSGIQKFNSGFQIDIFPWLMKPLLSFLPHRAQDVSLRAGILVPVIELAIGLGLLNSSVRRAAIVAAVLMHCLLLFALGPLGHDTNDVVWVWNFVMIVLVIALFNRTPDLRARNIVAPNGQGFRWFILIVATVAPVLSLFGSWDHYPSWALYSGLKDDCAIYVSDMVYDRLPDGIQAYVDQDKGGINSISIGGRLAN